MLLQLLVFTAHFLCTAAFSPLLPTQMGSVDASDLHSTRSPCSIQMP